MSGRPRTERSLDTGWVLTCSRPADGTPAAIPEAVVPATVPGCVHTDLLAVGLIPDPFDDANEHDVAWVAACDWRYTCRFTIDPDVLAHDHVELRFDGLDTLATVTLNGTPIATTANMHRRYRFDITSIVGSLGDGRVNELIVEFASATEYVDRLVASEGLWPSASFGRPFNYLRKMACSWGWDWGPWLTSAGVWRAATVVGWSDGLLGDVRPHITVGADERGVIDVDLDLDVAAEPAAGPLTLVAELTAPDGSAAGDAVTIDAVTGVNRLTVDAGMIERWWPHTHGAQPLYELTVRLLAGDAAVDTRTVRVGFRTIELDTGADATGAAFTFVVNGRPIFVRGVNWIPDDAFPTRITAERYRERLTQAVDAHCDMIRVWGGGIYEDDRFYDLCDELGLLVWQDFLFACAAYPEHLLAVEVEAEARDNVSRLMHHASLAIWNGNNENIWGYWDWGWQEVLAGRSWGAGFYHGTLPAVCAELDPGRAYWPGSPWSGSGVMAPNADAHGCVHVWDVWNQLDLDRYRDHTPRFVAEFGWQAPPSWTTMSEHVAPEHFRRDSAAMRNHQKATDGDLKLDRGIVARFGPIDDLESFWYAAQVVQARAVRTGIEHFRSLRPYCMGTIWWQLNDCWPVASWAVVDSAGRPKPAWDALRDAYRPRLLTIQPRGDRLVLFAVNDTDQPWELDATVQRLRLDGDTVAAERITVRVEPWETHSVVIGPTVALPADPRDEVIVAADAAGGGEAWWWFAPDRELTLRPSALVATWSENDGRVEIDLSSQVVVRDLVLTPERVDPAARIDPRVVTLRPGATTRVTVTGLGVDDMTRLLTAPACRSVADLFA